MRVITFNANGIRAAARKGFYDWLSTQDADFVCIQELKAQAEQLQDPIFWPAGYRCFYRSAAKKGYSGVAVYSRWPPDAVECTLDWPAMDTEGRFVEVRLGNLSVVSVYLPSGSSGQARQSFKDDLLDGFADLLQRFQASGRSYILAGDWNIAHRPIDLKNWKSNQKNSGFLPEERAWLDRVFDELGWVDAFRVVNQQPEHYTWWSHRGQAWAKNVGWRIDYQVVTPDLAERVRHAEIYTETRFSDHAPLTLDYAAAPGS